RRPARPHRRRGVCASAKCSPAGAHAWPTSFALFGWPLLDPVGPGGVPPELADRDPAPRTGRSGLARIHRIPRSARAPPPHRRRGALIPACRECYTAPWRERDASPSLRAPVGSRNDRGVSLAARLAWYTGRVAGVPVPVTTLTRPARSTTPRGRPG